MLDKPTKLGRAYAGRERIPLAHTVINPEDSLPVRPNLGEERTSN